MSDFVIYHRMVHLQQKLYQVPFKWEPEGEFLSQGECCVSCTPTPLKCRLQALGLHSLCEYGALKACVANGKAIALNLGRGGGCTHTHTHRSQNIICR